MTTLGWLLIVTFPIVATIGYRYSLSRRPSRRCHSCNGGGKHPGWVFRYAAGPCKARTPLPPRATCGENAPGGWVPRYGVRVLHLDGK